MNLTIPVPKQPVVIFGEKLGYVPAYTLSVSLPAVAHANPELKFPTMPDWLKALLSREFAVVWPVVEADLIAVAFGQKTWEDVGKDVLAALANQPMAA